MQKASHQIKGDRLASYTQDNNAQNQKTDSLMHGNPTKVIFLTA